MFLRNIFNIFIKQHSNKLLRTLSSISNQSNLAYTVKLFVRSVLRQTKIMFFGSPTQCTLAVSKVFQEPFGPSGRNPTFAKTYIMVADGTMLLQFDNISPILAVFRLSDKSFPKCPLGGVITKIACLLYGSI